MTNEAVLVFETSPAIPFTVANGTGIEKGAHLKLTDSMTAIINSGDSDAVAGVAASEKIASDGKTRLGVYRGGIFKVLISGTVTVGDALKISTVVNALATTAVNDENIWGTALESGTDAETILAELNPRSINVA